MSAFETQSADLPDAGSGASARDTLIGLGTALVVVVVWAAWIVGTRFAATNELPLAWLALFRYGVPALVLAPVWLRTGPLPRGVPPRLLALTVLGSGAPFFAVTATGLGYASAAEAGVLLPGTMGLWAALLAKLVLKERFGRLRTIGFALSIGGVVLIATPILAAGHFGAGLGRLLLPCGAFLWAVYTLAFRQTGLPALAGAGVICFWSTLMILPFVFAAGLEPLLAQPTGAVLAQFVIQGILSGLLSLIGYGIAVSKLGGSQAAAFSALAPALATLLAIPVLGEIPTSLVVAGVVVTMLGVALSSGALGGLAGRRRGGRRG